MQNKESKNTRLSSEKKSTVIYLELIISFNRGKHRTSGKNIEFNKDPAERLIVSNI